MYLRQGDMGVALLRDQGETIELVESPALEDQGESRLGGVEIEVS